MGPEAHKGQWEALPGPGRSEWGTEDCTRDRRTGFCFLIIQPPKPMEPDEVDDFVAVLAKEDANAV